MLRVRVRLFLVTLALPLGFFVLPAQALTPVSLATPNHHVVQLVSIRTSDGRYYDATSAVDALETFAAAVEANSEQKAAQAAAALVAEQQLQAKQAEQKSAQATVVSTSPVVTAAGGGWNQVAVCEEGGANDPVHGYFGIESSNWADGVSPASSYAEQEAFANQLNGGHAPWCPPTCAAGGYRGW